MSSDILRREDLWEYTWVSPALPSGNWRDASYVLFAESHDDDIGKERNSRLIDQLITPNSILLVEGVRSQWQPISQQTAIALSLALKISELAHKNLSSIIGWDYFNYRGDPAFICQFDPEKTQYTISLGDDDRDKPALCKLVRTIKSGTQDGLGSGLLNLLTLGETISTFPKRTEAMIQTLQAVERRKSLDPSIGKVFLVAGKAHLIEGPWNATPQTLLGPLYAELSRLPAAVISCGPK
jgi:hypothetical protein